MKAVSDMAQAFGNKVPVTIEYTLDVSQVVAAFEAIANARPWHLASGGSVTIPFTGIFDNGATDAPKEGG
jgi:hypothetical protein